MNDEKTGKGRREFMAGSATCAGLAAFAGIFADEAQTHSYGD